MKNKYLHDVEWSRLLTEFNEHATIPDGDLEGLKLARVWRQQLLDLRGWGQILEKYSHTVGMAVALTDLQGNILGDCFNPQPVWSMARASRPAAQGECSFCLSPLAPCTAVAEALKTGKLAIVQDRAGLAHMAVPVMLGGQALAVISVGQVFCRYPEALPLQRVARDFGVSAQSLWRAATLQVPVTPKNLRVYGDLLESIADAYLGQRFGTILYRKVVESNLRIGSSLEEKVVLLNEIHHRVKNNLQIVSSLLAMQAARFDPVADASMVEALEASRQRINTMAQIHNFLYSHEQVGKIDLAVYVRNLVEMLISALPSKGQPIRSRFELTPVMIGMDRAVPCGLIVNELVTNAFKYAYPNGEGGEILIGLGSGKDGRISLQFADHGVGLPAGLDWRNSNSLGLRIVRILAKQMNGKFEVDTARGGVTCTVSFPPDKVKAGFEPVTPVAAA